ncbi:leucine-rich repeat domain-containing protein [Treponema sp. OMZ 799]|uniref:leucine-rich repeat domain-containing protein n=1 Tax=Treponema sp. OMZ 799 TaxID=2563668 RepID=UPI0020A2E80A|nr:leucine-rich repeat domain-containing protein [Treponema sp. OMZ 799]UTC76639.1 leucine-rich repeat domain-containing protein [Treponema sp. OMZ 799]
MTNLHKKRGAALITAAVLALIALFGMTGCPNAAGEGGGKPTPTPMPNQAVLTLSSDMLNIKVKAKTSDGSAIQVDGCTETRLKSDEETELHAKGTRVILKGKITELYCSKNKLTALNVQGLTALERLDCESNQLPALNVQGLTALKKLKCGWNELTALNVQGLTALKELKCGRNKLTALNVQALTALERLDCSKNKLPALNVQGLNALKELVCDGNQIKAQAMTELLKALPARDAGDGAKATLFYFGWTGEGNCENFTAPPELKAAFEGAKSKNWRLLKRNASGFDSDI